MRMNTEIEEYPVVKVAKDSDSNAVAGSIAGYLREGHTRVDVVSVGAGALNQAIKAIATARGYVVPSGLDIVSTPTFHKVDIKGETKTAIKNIVEVRYTRSSLMRAVRRLLQKKYIKHFLEVTKVSEKSK